jgi:hypothetical protein
MTNLDICSLDVSPLELESIMRSLGSYSNRDEALEQARVWMLAVLEQSGYGVAAQLYREMDE